MHDHECPGQLPARVRIVEVGPRDGLQNESAFVPTDVKVELVERLVEAGVRHIEAAAFVSPKWVPQMADGADVLRRVKRRGGVRYSALVPNEKGLEAALDAGCDEVAVFAAASETFSRKNINCSIDESLARFVPVVRRARAIGVPVRGYVSCVLGCPFEGAVAPAQAARVAWRLYEMGCGEISLGDTIGAGTPQSTRALIEACAASLSVDVLAGHFHDTWGMAIANVYAALQCGIATFDSSVSGLGGCPYSPGATGNVATEDVLYLCEGLGIETGIDRAQVAAAGAFVLDVLGKPPASRVATAMAAQQRRRVAQAA